MPKSIIYRGPNYRTGQKGREPRSHAKKQAVTAAANVDAFFPLPASPGNLTRNKLRVSSQIDPRPPSLYLITKRNNVPPRLCSDIRRSGVEVFVEEAVGAGVSIVLFVGMISVWGAVASPLPSSDSSWTEPAGHLGKSGTVPGMAPSLRGSSTSEGFHHCGASRRPLRSGLAFPSAPVIG